MAFIRELLIHIIAWPVIIIFGLCYWIWNLVVWLIMFPVKIVLFVVYAFCMIAAARAKPSKPRK